MSRKLLTELRQKAERRVHEESPGPAGGGEVPRAKLLHELRVHQVELEQQNEELTAARRALEAALQEHTQLFEFAPIGYFVVTANSTIRKVNLAGARVVGVERNRLVGLTLGAFIQPADMGPFQQLLATTFGRTAEGAEAAACEITLRWKGDKTSVRMTASPLPAGQSEVPTVLIAIEDITERKRAEEELRDANQRLLDADRRKNDFLGMLSHELRNPLAPIRNAIHILEHVELDGGGGDSAHSVSCADRANTSPVSSTTSWTSRESRAGRSRCRGHASTFARPSSTRSAIAGPGSRSTESSFACSFPRPTSGASSTRPA